MKINLSPQDVLQLSKMIKSGCIDTDKVESLRLIAQSYKPQQAIDTYDVCMYKKYIKAEWGLKPTPYNKWCKELSDEHKEHIANVSGSVERFYNECIGDIFRGLLSMSAIGMHQDERGDVPNSKEAIKIFNEYLKHRSDNCHYICIDDC